MSEFQYFDRIQAYVDGEMNLSERQSFDRAIAENDELRSEYEAYLATREALQVLAYQELGELKPVAKKRSVIRYWWVAAGFLLLISIGGLLYSQLGKSPDHLALQHYELPVLDLDRQAGNSPLQSGIAAFYREDFPSSIRFLNQIPDTSEAYLTSRYVLAHDYFRSGAYETAISLFTSLIDDSGFSLQEETRWYRLLAFLAASDTTSARNELLHFLEDPKGKYYKSAMEIRQALE
jgi:cytochrome c-type biogenesis protein CcmH/NrfG